MKAVWFISSFIFLFSDKLIGQTSVHNIVLYSVTEANGLSDNHVQCVLKDKNDFVWIGTADGLNVIDGSSITVFRHRNNDSSSLINNDILSLTEDSLGNIWVGTPTGLSCYVKQKKTFSSASPLPSPYGNSAFINCVLVDHQQRIWCSTDGGLLLFNPVGKSFLPFYNNTDKKNQASFCNKLTHLISDNDENKLWLSSADGVWSFDLNTFLYKKEISAENDSPYHELFAYVYESTDKKIWAGNWGNGLEKLDRTTGKVSHYFSSPQQTSVVKHITEVKEPNGKYVLWLDGNLLAFDPFAGIFFHFFTSSQLAEIPPVFPCYQSTDGWIWLASTAGLYIYNPQRQFFQHHLFPTTITSQEDLLAEWNNLLIVGGQSKNFLKLYDKNWNLKKDLSYVLEHSSGGNITQPFASALSMSIRNNNTLWIGNSEGIVKINIAKGNFVWFRHKIGDSTTLPRNFIAHLFFDSEKKLWVFPWREGIWIMDTLTGKCKKLWDGFIKENGITKRLLIASAAEDNNGNIWMADLDEGIVLYERKDGKFSKPFAKEIGEKTHTSSVFFRNGFLYSATSYSLIKWDEHNRKIQFFDLPVEMNKEIYDICPDKIGNWWIATKNGLVVFNEANYTFKRFTTADGLVNNDMDGTLFCRSDGTIVFGNAGYIITIDPQKFLAAVSTSTIVRVTEIFANEKPVEWNGYSTLYFNYRSNNILFKWALPDLSNPFRNQYYCKLQGIDAGWHYVGNKGEIQYANLSPGDYSIQLKASSANGISSSNIITITFAIKSPFWKTWWFIVLMSIVSAGIFFTIVRYISQRNLKDKLLQLEKEQAIEKERNRISRDMHDDLGSGLTKIAIMSEVVKKQLNEPEKAKQQLENISESSRELVDNLQDIIWVLNPRNDTLENLAAYIREYGLKYFEPFSIEIEFDYPEKFPEIKLSEETRRNIFLTIKESFNNISKHAWCNKVHILVNYNSNNIILKIKDDGQGFDITRVRQFGNGLINMQNRIEQIGGRYEIHTDRGKGTETIITIQA